MTERQTGFFDRRRVGQAVVTVISEGEALWAPHFPVDEGVWRAALPEADAAGRLPVGLTALHIQLGDASVLVDPGLPDPGTGGFITPKLEEVRRSPGLAAALTAIGVQPVAITHVVITHNDADHCYAIAADRDGEIVPRYPNARYYIGRPDWPSVDTRRSPEPVVVERLAVIERHGQLEVIDGEREIAPGITLLPTPGETPGHLVARVESEGERFYALGDLFHHGREFERLDWAPPGRDVEANQRSRERLLAEVAPSRALLVFTHERFPPWGRAEVAPAGGYRWRRAWR